MSRNQLENFDSVVSNSCFNNIFIGKYDSSGMFLDKYQLNSTSEALGSNIIVKNGDFIVTGTYRTNLLTNFQNQDYSIPSNGNKDIFLLKISDKCFKFHVHITVDTVYNKDSIVYILDAGSGYHSYLWNDTIIGGEYLQVSKEGKYKVLVTNEYGCRATDSILISDHRLKSLLAAHIMDSTSTSRILVYPNPTNGKVYCTLMANSDYISSIEVFDYSGKLIEKHDGLNDYKEILDLSDKPTGFYYLRIRTTKTKQSIKIVKQ
jgi:hypothetical protein